MHATIRAGMVAILATAGLCLASPVVAQVVSIPVGTTCTSSGQLCTPISTATISTNGPLQVAYTASAGHCSNVGVHFLVDNVELAVTPFLTPGQTSAVFTLSPVSPGTHTLGVQAEGTVSGCNQGTLLNWGGTVQIFGVSQSAAAIPAPGILLTALALLLGAYAVFRKRAA